MQATKTTRLIHSGYLIGLLCVVLTRPALSAEGPMLIVNTPQAEIKVDRSQNAKVLRTVEQGTRFWAFTTTD